VRTHPFSSSGKKDDLRIQMASTSDFIQISATRVIDHLCDFSPLQSHGPKVQDDSLQVPLLKDKKRGRSKAPAVVLGEHSSIILKNLFFLFLLRMHCSKKTYLIMKKKQICYY
jgi:hypothetical protein